MTPPDPSFGAPPPGPKKFPDYVPPTKVHYAGVKPATLHLRKCKLITNVGGRAREHTFDKGSITVGAMEDNDLVVKGSLISRLHARIEINRNKFVLIDQSTNGTFVLGKDGEEAFVRRDSMQIRGEGLIGLGKAPDSNSSQVIRYTCEE